MTIAIIGASGFIGSAVTRLLLDTTNHRLVLFSHKASQLKFSKTDERRLKHVDGSVLNPRDIKKALQSCDQAVYLVHLMGQGSKQFADQEAQAAKNFGKAAQVERLQRVVYVGGMGQTDIKQQLTPHLQSRQQTGQILRQHVKQLIELRTPMVVGDGGAGYEVLKKIVRLSPILPLPRWARGVTQPITVTDVARYVTAALGLPSKEHISIAIGGPEQLDYPAVARRYAAKHGRKLIVLPLPFVSQRLVTAGLRLIKTPATITVADMLASAGYSIDAGNEARHVFPTITPEKIDVLM